MDAKGVAGVVAATHDTEAKRAPCLNQMNLLQREEDKVRSCKEPGSHSQSS